MKARELKTKTIDELNQQLMELLREQFNLRMQKKISEITKTHLYKKVRAEIARVKTIIAEKEQVL